MQGLTRCSYEQIDPTPSAASSKPKQHAQSIAFTIQESQDSTEATTISISEITTRHLRRLKQSASDYLGRNVTAAVISIPTDFTPAQKKALHDSTKAADLEVLQLVPEPVVELLASDRKTTPHGSPVDKITVVADLGGTRSDVTVISVKGGMYTILATAHDYALGGRQCDDVLVEFFAKEFMKKHKSAGDPRQDARGLAKLRLEAESTKKSLSIGSTANFNVESLADGIDFGATINRTRYELLASKVFARFNDLISHVVKKADCDVLDINEVVLCGGSSHTPRIATNVRNIFHESTSIIAPSTFSDAVNPSELNVRGTALQAELIEGFETEDVEQSTHPAVTVTPHLSRTVGLVVQADATSKEPISSENNQSQANGIKQDEPAESFKSLIPAETALPVRRTLTFLNRTSDANGVLIRLCEGEREIKVSRPEPKANARKGVDEEHADSDEEEDEEDEEEEEVREKVWRVGTVLGELALKGVRQGARLTVQVTITTDLSVTMSATESGKTGVRGSIEGSDTQKMNGSAH